MPDQERLEDGNGTRHGSHAQLHRDGEAVVGLCEQVEHYIAEKPLRALAFAFLAGLVISRIAL